MIAIISPAKKLDFDSPVVTTEHTLPEDLDRSEQIINKLRRMSKKKLSELMGLSDNLTQLNMHRYAEWSTDLSTGEARQAILAFHGDVYQGMRNTELSADELEFAQEHLRILSGLHGLLRPLDKIRPYRLEMGTKLPVGRSRDLYAFWQDRVTERLNTDLRRSGSDILINLASNEYFKVVNTDQLNASVITPVFKDMRGGKLKVISLFAKQARGMMAGFMIRNRIEQPADLKLFDAGGYRFTEHLSDPLHWVFTR